jgi:nitrogen fixation protein FixH
MAMSDTAPGTIKGWHVLAGMLVFFGVIFAVNGYFLYAALTTHTGIVSKQPYRKGLDYNLRIEAEARQTALGWSHAVQIDQAGGRLELALRDRDDRPVSGLVLTGFMGRPSTEQHDMALRLVETATPGTYRTALPQIAGGNWLLQLEASRATPHGTEVVYRLKERQWLKH